MAAQNVAQLLEEIPSIGLFRTHVLVPERIEGLVGNDPMSRDRLSRAEERKTRYLAEHLEKKFGSRPDVTAPTTPGADSANAHNTCRTKPNMIQVKKPYPSSAPYPSRDRIWSKEVKPRRIR